jgi:SRSO17 transposase
LKGYKKEFVCHRTNNLHKCCQFITGLLHECKSNIERMVERIPNSNYDQLHHFISNSPWDSFAVMNIVAQKVAATLSLASSNGVSDGTGLILDESGWEKSGKKSVGVSRQYIGQVGKVANGQVGVFAALSRGNQVGILQGRLYLHSEWTNDKVRCDAAGIPTDDQIYRTKPELAVEIIKTLPADILYDWVGGDCIYGNSLALRQHLYDIKQPFVMDVGEDLGIYLELPKPYIPPKKAAGRGRTPTSYVCDNTPIALKNLIKEIASDKWQIITHRKGTKGDLVRKATILDVHIWKSEREEYIESVQLIISTELDGTEVKYSLCYNQEGSMPVEIALARQMQRYWVERAFQNVKEQLGLHQYQVRSWNAWHHHIALTLMALHFILEIQQDNKQDMPLLSIPDIKLVFAKKLLNNLNSDEGLLQALSLRHKKRKDDIDNCSRVPK